MPALSLPARVVHAGLLVCLALVVGALVHLPVIETPLVVPDDLGWATGYTAGAFLSHGRWLLHLWAVAFSFEVSAWLVWPLLFAAAAATGLVVARCWDVTSRVDQALIVGLFVISPGLAKFTSWELSIAPVALSFLASAVAVRISAGWSWHLLTGALLLAAGLAVYQPAISFAITLVVLSEALRWIREDARTWRQMVADNLPVLVTGAAGVALYALSLALGEWFGWFAVGRGLGESPPGPAEMLRRMVSGWEVWWHLLTESNLRFWFGGGAAGLLLLAACAAGLMPRLQPVRLGAWLMGVALLVVAMTMVFSHQYASPMLEASGFEVRAAPGVLLVPAFCLTWLTLHQQWGCALVGRVLVTVLLGYWVAFAHTYYERAHARQQQEQQLLQTVFADVTAHPQFSSDEPVVFPYGFPWGGYRSSAARASNELGNFLLDTHHRVSRETIRGIQARQGAQAKFWPDPGGIEAGPEGLIVNMQTRLARKVMPTGNETNERVRQAAESSTADAWEAEDSTWDATTSYSLTRADEVLRIELSEDSNASAAKPLCVHVARETAASLASREAVFAVRVRAVGEPVAVRMAYFTRVRGNSGWRYFELTREWQTLGFEYRLPPVDTGREGCFGLFFEQPGSVVELDRLYAAPAP